MWRQQNVNQSDCVRVLHLAIDCSGLDKPIWVRPYQHVGSNGNGIFSAQFWLNGICPISGVMNQSASTVLVLSQPAWEWVGNRVINPLSILWADWNKEKHVVRSVTKPLPPSGTLPQQRSKDDKYTSRRACVLYPFARGSVLLDENFLMEFLFLHPRNRTNKQTDIFLSGNMLYVTWLEGVRAGGFHCREMFILFRCAVRFCMPHWP